MRNAPSRVFPLAARLLTLSLSLFATVGAVSCVEQDDEKPTADDMAVAKQNILTTAPTPRYPVNADLDGKAIYLGLDVDPVPIDPGKEITLTHYWKVVAPLGGDGWRTFTHVEGPGKQSFTNADHTPVKGKYPVSAWKVGDIVRDVHTVRLPGGWNKPTVEVYVGLWRGAARMPVKSGPHDAEGRILAASIPVGVKSTVPEPRKRYVARMTTKPPKLDGKLDDPAWADAPSTGAFVNTLTGAPAAQKTEAKLLWDKKFLYVGIDNADTDVWSNLTKRDDKLWTQEADELMIDADGNGRTYIELQVAPNGNVFDTYLPERRKYEDTINPKMKPFEWNSKMIAKVHVDGTLNKREDVDKGWTAELAIPLEDVKGMDDKSGVKLPPSPGDVWRINMYRMDIPQGKPQQAAGWSPPMIGDFHALDRFGELVFGDAQGNVPPPSPPPLAKAAGKGMASPVASGPTAPPDRKKAAAQKGASAGGAKKQ
jgi:hypothetical protein